MMRKTLMVSENKEKDTAPERSTLIPFGDVDGCLAVDIKICRHFWPMIYLKYPKNLYIRISINNFVKYTKSFSLLSGNDEKKLVIEVDEMMFFFIQVPRRQDDKRNNISLGLVQCSDTENCLLCLGSIEVHLYEVVKKTHFTEELEILNENTCVCRLIVEFVFAHEAFGDGFSHQEVNINKIPESLSNNQHEKRSEDIITLGVPRRSNEGEITPMELLENDKKDLTIPTLKLWDQVNSIAVTPRIDESTPPPTDIAPSIMPTLKITEEGKLPHLHEQQSKAVPMDRMKKTRLPPIARRRDTHLSILETDSSSAKHGCLAVDIKICRHFWPMIYLKYPKNLYIRISINNFVKYTKSFSLLSGNDEKKLVIEVDEMMFFFIQVPRRQDDKRNNISLGLVQCSDTENCLLCLGSIEVHLYEVVKKTHFTEELEILNENTCVCRLIVEFVFAHEAFGDGFSHQEVNINKIPESLSNNQHEKRSEDIITLGVPRRSNEGEITPMELLENDKKDLTIPTLKLWDQVNSIAVTPRIDESTPPPTDIAPSIMPTLKITEEGKLPHLHEQQSKAVPMDRMKKTRLPPIARRRDTHLSILETDSSSAKEVNINKIPESLSNNQHEKRSEDIITLGVPRRSNEGEITPMELLENDKKDLTIPTLKLWDQVNSIAVTPRIDESTPPPTDIAPSIMPTLKITEEGKLPHLHEQQSKAVPMDRMKKTRLPPIARRRDTHLSILETDSSSAKDCSDKYEDDYVTAVQRPTKTQSRARLGGKNSDDSQNQGKHAARPYTAPEPNKQQESYTRKFPSP